jgi:ABC-type multidrug transport system fused ATPase/permease subunit
MASRVIPPNTATKLWVLLTPEQQRAAIVLLGLMLIGMVLETLGVGLVIPALALMTQGDVAAKYPALAPWLNSLGNPSQERLVIVGMLTLVGVYAVKTLFLAFLAWRQAHFVYGLQASLSQSLFAGYLRQPYIFHVQRNSAQLIGNTIMKVDQVTAGISNGVTLIAELSVFFGISAMLLVVEPLGALLVVSTLGLAGWGFNRVTRRHILRWGEAGQLHNDLRIQHLQQGLGGAKDVKLLGREDDFITQYKLHSTGYARANQSWVTLTALPRLGLELLAVTGLAALVMVIISQGKPMESLLPTLGLFAAAAFRLMPSASRMINAIHNVRYFSPMIDTLHSEFCLMDDTAVPQRDQPLPFKTALVLDQISFHYPSTEAHALHEVSFSIPRGASVGFIGVSGAGKSSLVDIILGLLTPVSGTVKVDGIDIQTNLRGWQDQIGYVPQSIYLTDDTLRRNVAFGLSADQIDDAAVWRAIRNAQLEQFINELPQGLDTLVGERGIRLSGGQRQRIGIARALYHDPAVLVLDEATSSLDTTTERGVMEAVRALQGNKTLLIVAHRLSTVEHCDRLIRFEKGKLMEEASARVLASPSLSTTVRSR